MQSAINSRSRLQPIDEALRPTSARANIQSHPCYQASLFHDNQRAAGSLDQWKKRMNLERSATQADIKETKRDYQLENIIWTQSVSFITVFKCQ